jgi:Outer membrane protein beta-barrel domain
MRTLKRTVGVSIVAMLAVAAVAAETWAAGRVIAGVDLGVARPIDRFRDRAGDGGVASPFLGYMFNDLIGIVGQAQIVGLPVTNSGPGKDDDTWIAAGHVGPRFALPLQLGASPSEIYGTWQGGAFTGLVAHTPVSRTSWGYSTGGGLNVGITQQLMLGAFVRYNWLDQHVAGQNVRYVTTGLDITYNIPVSKPAAH